MKMDLRCFECRTEFGTSDPLQAADFLMRHVHIVGTEITSITRLASVPVTYARSDLTYTIEKGLELTWAPNVSWKWGKWTFGFWIDPNNHTYFGIDFGPLEIVWHSEGYRP
jgi:hypothetical protein